MTMKLLSADQFRSEAKDGGHPDGTVFRFTTVDPQDVAGAQRTKRFVFSDATIDHAGDSIDPNGWDLGVFRSNPVALFSHMSWEPPIGRASNVLVANDQLAGDIEFATADVYEFADTIYRLVDGGFMKAVSVGFKPKEWAFTNDKNRPYGIDFKKQTLLEISVCPVPCNPNALSEARSLGIDTAPLQEWAEKVLDSGDTVFLPKSELERLRSQSVEREAPRYYLQSPYRLSADQAKIMREAVKRWQDDPNEVLILTDGLKLRTIGEHKDAGDWKCGAVRDLPIDEEGTWDGPAAEASIFEHAGGDDFDPAIARKGFLAYDASAPKLRGSYKLPFARVEGGELKAMASGIRAAASRLPQTDIPDDVKTSARDVLDAYEAKMKDGDKTFAELIAKLEASGGLTNAAIMEAFAAIQVGKAGRRISNATKAKLAEAMTHHEAMGACIKEVMEDGQPGDDDPDGDGDNDGGGDPDALTPQPPGSVVLESDMSPEELRLKEARALKASLPKND